jgi:hypothetical protein
MPLITPEELRDEDARGAMKGLLAGRGLPLQETDPQYPDEIAKLAFDIAEAMAEERARRGGR